MLTQKITDALKQLTLNVHFSLRLYEKRFFKSKTIIIQFRRTLYTNFSNNTLTVAVRAQTKRSDQTT